MIMECITCRKLCLYVTSENMCERCADSPGGHYYRLYYRIAWHTPGRGSLHSVGIYASNVSNALEILGTREAEILGESVSYALEHGLRLESLPAGYPQIEIVRVYRMGASGDAVWVLAGDDLKFVNRVVEGDYRLVSEGE